MTLEQFKKKAKQIPDSPGVYFFLGPPKPRRRGLGHTREILYIGKATSLRDRVRSYFANDLAETRGALIVQMLEKAVSIDFRKTDSVLEALLLESSLIHSHKPPHNTDSKDDKSWNHVLITDENFPQVLVVRTTNLGEYKAKKIFGPFPHGLQLREAMKLIRRIFPYRDEKCKPGQKRPCFNRQIGLCPGVCTGEISAKEYRKTVRHIVLLFEGKKKQLLKSLAKEMRAAAKEENFEQAKELHRQLYALQHIQDISLIKSEYRNPKFDGLAYRIEAYDIAHLQGSAHVGVMTVVEGGEAAKSQYRKFKIKTAKQGDDPGALREVLSRRLGHDEWPLPRLIVVDGSTAQINAAQTVLAEYGMSIPVVGVVKDEKHRPRNILGGRELIKTKEREILLANAEAHRFAIGYHRNKSRKNLVI